MPALSKSNRIYFWDFYQDMLKKDRLSFEELSRIQFRRLKQMLIHANEHVPFYRERFRQAGIDVYKINRPSDILRIPPLTKEDIMRNFPDQITANGLDRRKWMYVATSGTTKQVMGIYDFIKANLNWAAGLRAHKQAGGHELGKKWLEIPPYMCSNICGENYQNGDNHFLSKELLDRIKRLDLHALNQYIFKQVHARRQKAYRRLTLPSFSKAGTNIPEASLRGYVERIQKYKPYLLEGLPLYIYALAKFILDEQISPPKVGVIKPIGGSITDLMKQKIKRAFRCDIYDTYGCSETGFVASDCDLHDGLHYFMDLYYIEICRDNDLLPPGELGKLYLTDLSNKAMPLIRYDIGDVAHYSNGNHSCVLKAERIKVQGRLYDTLINSRGKIFASDRVFDFFHAHEEIDNFQLIQKEEKSFDLLVVPKRNRLIDKEKLANEFNDFYGETVACSVYLVKSIKSEPGGKFRFVKSTTYYRLN
ncbi:MAG: phenylacetate--CoA ligase family protein [bacterium]